MLFPSLFIGGWLQTAQCLWKQEIPRSASCCQFLMRFWSENKTNILQKCLQHFCHSLKVDKNVSESLTNIKNVLLYCQEHPPSWWAKACTTPTFTLLPQALYIFPAGSRKPWVGRFFPLFALGRAQPFATSLGNKLTIWAPQHLSTSRCATAETSYCGSFPYRTNVAVWGCSKHLFGTRAFPLLLKQY